MERRAVLAFVISLLILILYQEVVIKRLYPPPAEEPQGPVASAPSPPVVEPSLEQPAPPVTTAEKSAPIEGHDVVIETDRYRAVFTTAGARLVSFTLKRFRTTVAPDSPPLDVLSGALDPNDLPLGLTLRGATESISDGRVSYRADQDALSVPGDGRGSVTFTGALDGTTITKRVDVQGDTYLVGLEVTVSGPAATVTEMALGWEKRLGHPPVPGAEVLFDAILAVHGDKLEHFDWNTLETVHEKDIRWVGYSGRYFLAAMIPPATVGDAARMWLKRNGDVVDTQLLLPPATFNARVDLYIGPKAIGELERTGHSLRRAVDLGWFTFVALPLLELLKLSHRLTGNYGVDIILLTVIIKILFIPLTQKSLKSMREMQKLQPQMVKIRERLKDKPEEMNKEIMELYRRHKVNPLGGCLPMVLQIPVFVGLYNALMNAVELRHAPFVGWINDLSAPDRLGAIHLPFVEPPGIPVLTLLMGASMFIQQWMTPSATADPMQQRIMLMMPVMFTFMFINFPAGLTLYWLVNNILTIAQQYAMNRPER